MATDTRPHGWSAAKVTLFALSLALLGSAAFLRPAAYGSSLPKKSPAVPGSFSLWQNVLEEHQRKLATGEEDPEDLFWAAVAQANLGQIEDSRRYFQRLDAVDPERTATERILQKVRVVLLRDAQNLQALNGVAFLEYARNDYLEAAKSFQEVVRRDPLNPWPRCYLGFSLGKGGRVDEAVRVLEEGVRAFPQNEVLHFLLGLAYYQKGAIVKALLEMAKAPTAVRYFR